MFKSLRNRLLVLNMTIISIVMIAAFAVIYFITYTSIQKENESKLELSPSLSRVALGNLDQQESPSHSPDTRILFPRIPVDYSLSFSILVDRDGQMLDVLSYLDMPYEAYSQIAVQAWESDKLEGGLSFENRKWMYRVSSFDWMRVVRENGELHTIRGNGLYQIAFLDITDSSKTLTRLLITFILVGFAMLFILFAVSVHFANRSIRPIEESWLKQKQFVADASHELKTPLAIINANADALLANGQETVNSQRKWIDYIQADSGRMGKLVNDMLYLAKVEDIREDFMPFDISNTVMDIAASMEAVLFERGIRLSQTIEPGIIVKGDSEKIKQAVLILLDNAVKYTDAGGQVDIALTIARSYAVFSVQNSGKGIPADQLPRVFDRFYRIDPSRSQATGGYGLGLAIAKAIVERSGGSIRAESTADSNTFVFELKLN